MVFDVIFGSMVAVEELEGIFGVQYECLSVRNLIMCLLSIVSMGWEVV